MSLISMASVVTEQSTVLVLCKRFTLLLDEKHNHCDHLTVARRSLSPEFRLARHVRVMHTDIHTYR
jgi:hypothetical protein